MYLMKKNLSVSCDFFCDIHKAFNLTKRLDFSLLIVFKLKYYYTIYRTDRLLCLREG